jgi:HAD superfamily hydrolase (TIGR01509 family)
VIDDLHGVVFDLDGTLVRSEHDYAALKSLLGLPRDLAILEGIATRPAEERAALFAQVDAWEQALAARATPHAGADAALEGFATRGVPVGIVTRNTRATALATLRAAGLERWFDPGWVLGRDEAPPKPSPDGILLLVRAWSAEPGRVAMVGDFTFDLLAARAARVRAIGYDPEVRGHLDSVADVVIRHLGELVVPR